MQTKTCDAWGIVINNFGLEKQQHNYVYTKNIPHIQSYFIVLRSKVFNSSWFYNFIIGITKESNKHDIIIKYEQGLSLLITQNNYTIDSYIPFDSEKRDLAKNWKRTIEENGLLIKKSQYKDIILHLNFIKFYPVILIKKFAQNKIGIFKYYKMKLYNTPFAFF